MATDTADRRLITLVLTLVAVLVIVPVFGMGFGMMGGGPMHGTWAHGMWGDGGTGPGWWLLAALVFRVLFLAAIVGGGYLLFRAVTGDGDRDRAMEELRLAYARGDLTDEEYESRRQALERES